MVQATKSKNQSKSKKEEHAMSITIDYPKENEKVKLGPYTIRVSSQGRGMVQLSLKKGKWEPCRLASGYYWFDWQPEKPGVQKISVRMLSENKKQEAVAERRCEIIQ